MFPPDAKEEWFRSVVAPSLWKEKLHRQFDLEQDKEDTGVSVATLDPAIEILLTKLYMATSGEEGRPKKLPVEERLLSSFRLVCFNQTSPYSILHEVCGAYAKNLKEKLDKIDSEQRRLVVDTICHHLIKRIDTNPNSGPTCTLWTNSVLFRQSKKYIRVFVAFEREMWMQYDFEDAEEATRKYIASLLTKMLDRSMGYFTYQTTVACHFDQELEAHLAFFRRCIRLITSNINKNGIVILEELNQASLLKEVDAMMVQLRSESNTNVYVFQPSQSRKKTLRLKRNSSSSYDGESDSNSVQEQLLLPPTKKARMNNDRNLDHDDRLATLHGYHNSSMVAPNQHVDAPSSLSGSDDDGSRISDNNDEDVSSATPHGYHDGFMVAPNQHVDAPSSLSGSDDDGSRISDNNDEDVSSCTRTQRYSCQEVAKEEEWEKSETAGGTTCQPDRNDSSASGNMQVTTQKRKKNNKKNSMDESESDEEEDKIGVRVNAKKDMRRKQERRPGAKAETVNLPRSGDQYVPVDTYNGRLPQTYLHCKSEHGTDVFIEEGWQMQLIVMNKGPSRELRRLELDSSGSIPMFPNNPFAWAPANKSSYSHDGIVVFNHHYQLRALKVDFRSLFEFVSEGCQFTNSQDVDIKNHGIDGGIAYSIKTFCDLKEYLFGTAHNNRSAHETDRLRHSVVNILKLISQSIDEKGECLLSLLLDSAVSELYGASQESNGPNEDSSSLFLCKNQTLHFFLGCQCLPSVTGATALPCPPLPRGAVQANQLGYWSAVMFEDCKPVRIWLSVGCQVNVVRMMPMVAEELEDPGSVGKKHMTDLIQNHSGCSNHRLREMKVKRVFMIASDTNSDVVQVVLYPDLASWPHGHYNLASGTLPDDFACKIVEPTHRTIQKGAAVPQVTTFSINQSQLAPAFALVIKFFLETAAEKCGVCPDGFGMRDMWDFLLGTANTTTGTPAVGVGGVQRQRKVGHFPMYHDFGVNGGQDQSQRDPEGFGKPSFKGGNVNDPFVKELFPMLSEILEDLDLKWIWDGMPPERVKEFAAKLATDNIIEAVRIALNIVDGTCKSLVATHVDGLNCRKFPRVLTFSQIIWIIPGIAGFRVIIILYTRKCVHDYLSRRKADLPLLQKCIDTLQDMPSERLQLKALVRSIPSKFDDRASEESACLRVLLQDSKQGVKQCADFLAVPCHLNPLLFISNTLSCIMKLLIKFKLNYIEVCSLLRASAVFIERPYYACTAMLEVLAGESDIVAVDGSLSVRGFTLGLAIAKRITEIHDTFGHLKYDKKLTDLGPGYRFMFTLDLRKRAYGHLEAVWEKEVMGIATVLSSTLLGTDGSNAHAAPSSKKRHSMYDTALANLTGEMDGYDVLAGNHLLAAAAVLGLVPYWYVHECKVNHSGKVVEFFKTMYNKANKDNPDAPAFNSRRFVGELQSAINQHDMLCEIIGECTRRINENGSCKIKRILDKEDSSKSDLIFDGQAVFEAIGQQLVLYHVSFDGRSPHNEKTTLNGPIVQRWALPSESVPTILGSPQCQLPDIKLIFPSLDQCLMASVHYHAEV